MLPFPFQSGGFGQSILSGDPYFDNVVLLLHMDGANNSTTFTDSSRSPKTVTASGNAKISTTQSKFGGASGAFDGTGDYLSSSYNADYDFITGDFTFECFIYPTTSKTARILTLCGSSINWNSTTGIHFVAQQVNQNISINISNNTGTPLGTTTTGNLITINAWNHVAFSKSGTTGYIGINGTVSSFSASGAARPSGNPTLAVATYPGENGTGSFIYQGNMDDLRITKGVARYTANFTPPTEPFPNN